jgi:hypothetical protein
MSITQLGSNILGELAGDYSGSSVSLNNDGTRVAIGARFNNGSGIDSGHVRIYEYSNGTWSQLGSDIDAESAGDQFGYAVSMDSAGNRVAIGAYNNDGGGNNSGHVRVYEYSSGTWSQLGPDVDGEAANYWSGHSLSLTSDGTKLAIGSHGGGTNVTGYVKVFEYNSTTNQWDQIGSRIDGEAEYDHSGWSVSFSDDGSKLAIGANYNDASGVDSGHVRVFEYSAGNWLQVGSDIDGELAGDHFGYAVSMNSDGTRLAIGAYFHDSRKGHVRVYEYSSGAWSQLGSDFDGEAADDHSGISVSLNDIGNVLAIGAHMNDGNGTNSGHVKVYQYTDSTWSQIDTNIVGETSGDGFGYSVNLNGDGSILAVGAQGNDAGGADSGHVKVYSIPIPETSLQVTLTVDSLVVRQPATSAEAAVRLDQLEAEAARAQAAEALLLPKHNGTTTGTLTTEKIAIQSDNYLQFGDKWRIKGTADGSSLVFEFYTGLEWIHAVPFNTTIQP